jgi:hypothetical protein
VRANYSHAELRDLERELRSVAHADQAGTVDWGLRQVVFERPR